MPELASLDRSERRRILRDGGAQSAWIGIVARSAFIGLLAFGASISIFDMDGRSEVVRLAIGATCSLFAAAVVMQIQMHLARVNMRLQIMALLRGERVPVCLTCGYDQAANTTDRCP